MQLEFHPTAVHVLPIFSIEATDCGNAECAATHVQISLGWGFWRLSIYFSL